MSFRVDTVLLVGAGLIGGSFALALKAAGAVRRVIGIDRDAGNLDRALALEVIDEAGTYESAGVADLVLVAVPVGALEAVLRELAPRLGERTLVTDVGSTKSDVIEHARLALGAKFNRFVAGHPISGSDASGAAAASASLFRGRRVVLTPVAETSVEGIESIAAAWNACGAVVERLDPHEHDRILAAVSHLPHVIAYALAERVGRDSDPQRLLDHAAGAFRDLTRIAASNPELWRDVCIANRVALLEEIDHYRDSLDRITGLIASGDGAELERLFERARVLRNTWGSRDRGE